MAICQQKNLLDAEKREQLLFGWAEPPANPQSSSSSFFQDSGAGGNEYILGPPRDLQEAASRKEPLTLGNPTTEELQEAALLGLLPEAAANYSSEFEKVSENESPTGVLDDIEDLLDEEDKKF